ncbi:MAG: DegQ family serine endoprotease [Candidatus Brocadiales bacterium]
MRKRLRRLSIILLGPALLVLFISGSPICKTSSARAERSTAEIEKLQESAEQFQRLFSEVAEYVKPSVVHVKAVKIMKTEKFEQFHPFGRGFPFGDEFFDRFFRRRMPKEFRQQGFGSGVIVDSKGYILTNNHVVEDADEIYVIMPGKKKELKAEIVGADPPTDVAVIKIEGDGLPVATLGDSDGVRIGDWAIAVGNPFGLTETVTAGIISATGRANVGIADYEDFIQTDAAINPGNSGGPLVNLKGEVIGINTAIFTRTGGYQGIGFAIPINMAKTVMQSLIAHKKVVRGWLGVAIQDISEELAESFGLPSAEGILVSDVTHDSPAEKGGMQRGDVILEYQGKKVEDINHLRILVAQTPVGTKASLKVLRENKPKYLTITIGEQPADLFARGPAAAMQPSRDYGMTLENLTPELARRFGYEDEVGGVLVADVEPGGQAEMAGIRSGDLIKEVNRERVHNRQEFFQIVEKSPEEKGLLLLVKRGTTTRYVLLKPE